MVCIYMPLQKERKWTPGKETVLGLTFPSCNPQQSLSSLSHQVLLWCDCLRWQGTWCSGWCALFLSYTPRMFSPAFFGTGILAEKFPAESGAKGNGHVMRTDRFVAELHFLSESFQHFSRPSLLCWQTAFGRTSAILDNHWHKAKSQLR